MLDSLNLSMVLVGYTRGGGGLGHKLSSLRLVTACALMGDETSSIVEPFERRRARLSRKVPLKGVCACT